MNAISTLSWFGRLGRSLKGILAGLLLAVVSVVLLVGNERNAVRDIRANQEVDKKVVSVSHESIDPAQDGQLIHFNGSSATEDFVSNDQFGIRENAIRLRWQAEVFHWHERSERTTERKTGGSETTTTTYSYEKKWSPEAIDSSQFQDVVGHENPSQRRFRSAASQAERVTVGAYQLPQALIAKIISSEPYPLAEIPVSLAQENASLNGGVYYTGSPTDPQIGDERVSFSLTKPMPVSVLAVQNGNTLEPFRAKNGKVRFELREGLLSAKEMVLYLEQQAKFLRWALRIGGFVLMAIGFSLVLKPLSVFADIVPFLGNLVGAATGFIATLFAAAISLILIALGWLTFRPLLAVPLLVIAGLAIFFAVKKLTARKAPQPAIRV